MATPTIPIPSLSSNGWVTAQAQKADLLMAHFFASDALQSYLYINNVSSLPYIVEQAGDDIITLTQQLRLTLEKYLGRYYDLVDVDITNVDDPLDSSKVNLNLYIKATDNGKDYVFAKLIETVNGKLSKIVNLNNG